MNNIEAIQVLVFGNTGEDEAVEFCNSYIVEKFKTVESEKQQIKNKRDALQVGCLYQKNKENKNSKKANF